MLKTKHDHSALAEALPKRGTVIRPPCWFLQGEAAHDVPLFERGRLGGLGHSGRLHQRRALEGQVGFIVATRNGTPNPVTFAVVEVYVLPALDHVTTCTTMGCMTTRRRIGIGCICGIGG